MARGDTTGAERHRDQTASHDVSADTHVPERSPTRAHSLVRESSSRDRTWPLATTHQLSVQADARAEFSKRDTRISSSV